MKAPWRVGLTVWCMGLVLASNGSAYVLTGQDWSYLANPIGENWTVCDAGMPDGGVQRTKDGAAGWNYANFSFPFGVDVCASEGAFPSFNFVNQVDVGHLSANVLAVTVWYYQISTGNIFECDMRFSSDFEWYTGTGSPPSNQFDWHSVAIHEMGHCVGLGHENRITRPAVMASTFAPGEVRRTLTADDRAGRNTIYGNPPGLAPFVAGFYQDVLGRQPEPAGLAAWVDFLVGNCNASGFNTLGVGFFDSGEFRTRRTLTLTGLVTALYRAFLDRDPEPGGLAAWTQYFRGERVVIANQGFLPSPEFQSLLPNRSDRAAVTSVVGRFYTEILGRAAEPAGLNAWVDYVVMTGDLEGAAVAFITSPEFETRPLTFRGYVTILYRALLGRDPDPGGLDSWEGVLRNHLVGIIEAGFVPSPEFQAEVPRLCGS